MAIKKTSDLAGLRGDMELVTVVVDGVETIFIVDEICIIFFNGFRETDELVQEYANELVRAVAPCKQAHGAVVSILNLKHICHETYPSLREELIARYYSLLRHRNSVMYDIALECFHELCAGLPPETIKKRLDEAIENTIKEQQT